MVVDGEEDERKIVGQPSEPRCRQATDSGAQNDEADKNPGLAHSVLMVTAGEFILMVGLFFFSFLAHI